MTRCAGSPPLSPPFFLFSSSFSRSKVDFLSSCMYKQLDMLFLREAHPPYCLVIRITHPPLLPPPTPCPLSIEGCSICHCKNDLRSPSVTTTLNHESLSYMLYYILHYIKLCVCMCVCVCHGVWVSRCVCVCVYIYTWL
jgi:hypothetical protein